MLYVADQEDGEIWRVDANKYAAPIAGFGAPLFRNGDGFFSFIESPRWIAYNSDMDEIEFCQTAPQLHGTYVTASLTTTGPTPAPRASPASRFEMPSIPAEPQGIVTARNQSAWVVESGANKVLKVGKKGNIAEYAAPANFGNLQSVVVDASGDAWISGTYGHTAIQPALIEVRPDGSVSGYPITDYVSAGGSIGGITLGPDDNVWFTLFDSNGGAVGFINAATGTVQQFRITDRASARQPHAIATGPGGNLWFYMPASGSKPAAMGRINVSGTILPPIPLRALPTTIWKMALNRNDGSIWWVDGDRYVGSVSPKGLVRAFDLDDGRGAPGISDITVGPDGSLWVPESTYGDIANVTTSGAVTRYWLPKAPEGAAARSDGTVWAASLFGETYLLDPKAYDDAGFPHP